MIGEDPGNLARWKSAKEGKHRACQHCLLVHPENPRRTGFESGSRVIEIHVTSVNVIGYVVVHSLLAV